MALYLAATALSSWFAAPTVAAAQTAEGASDSDIIVTGLRRDQRVQDAPVAITAMTGGSLQAQGVRDFYDYYRTVPSLQITANSVSPGQARISLRGILSGGESTTGLYYGETPVTGPAGTTADASLQTPNLVLYDIERIEVLRGPQGTLYGASSLGGTVRTLFAKPDPGKLGGRIDVEGRTTQHGGEGGYLRGMLNVPLIPGVLAARVVGYTERIGGYVDNIRYGRKDVNDGSISGGRVSLAYTPTDDLDVTGTAIYQKSHYDDTNTWYQALGKKAYLSDGRVRTPFKDEFQLYNATANKTFSFGKLTLASSYYKWKLARDADITATVYPSIAGATASSPACLRFTGITTPCSPTQLAAYQAFAFSTIPGSANTPIRMKTQTHEARFASVGENFIDWTFGIFYEKRKDHSDSILVKADPATGDIIHPFVINGNRYVETDLKQFSQFGEISIHPAEKLALTAGTRHYHYSKTVAGQVLQNAFILGSFVGPRTQQKVSESGWVSKLQVSYKPSEDILGYVTWSQGFRPGGANNVPGLAANLVSYKADSLESYEAGLKSSWLRGRLVANVAVFQINWSDMQTIAFVPPAFRVNTNAGKARIRGLEFETTGRPIKGLTLTGGFNYLPTAKLTRDQVANGSVITAQTGLAGDRIPFTSKFNASLSGEYGWTLSDGLDAFVRLDASHRSASATELRPTFFMYNRLKGFTALNARIGINHGSWKGTLYVDNVTGTVGPLVAQTLSVTPPVTQEKMLGSLRPRTVGISVSKEF